MAYAERVLHGRWQADAFYEGETLWYNPLVPWMVAGMSAVVGLAWLLRRRRAPAASQS